MTTGNSLTIAAGVRSLFRGADEMGIDASHATAVVVGATGSIGGACVELIAPHVAHVILVARNETRLRKFHENLAGRLPCESSYTTDISDAVRRADLILTATSSTQDVIEPEDLRTGAVVCEISLPHDVSRRVASERPDVLVVEQGVTSNNARFAPPTGGRPVGLGVLGAGQLVLSATASSVVAEPAGESKFVRVTGTVDPRLLVRTARSLVAVDMGNRNTLVTIPGGVA